MGGKGEDVKVTVYTNVLVRAVIRYDEKQNRAAVAVLGEAELVAIPLACANLSGCSARATACGGRESPQRSSCCSPPTTSRSIYQQRTLGLKFSMPEGTSPTVSLPMKQAGWAAKFSSPSTRRRSVSPSDKDPGEAARLTRPRLAILAEPGQLLAAQRLQRTGTA